MRHHRMKTNFSLVESKNDEAAALLAMVVAEQDGGPTTTALTDQLWVYGWVTLHACLADGRIAHLGAGPGARDLDERDLERFTVQSTRDDLVCTTLIEAVPKFVDDVLQRDRYDPHRGTSIATFFTGFVLRRLRCMVLPRWADETRRREYELGAVRPDDEWFNVSTSTPDHADGVLHALSAHQATVYVIKNFANVAERPVALGVLRGQTHSEIAADLGITPKAVERRLASFRQKAWRHRPPEAQHDQDGDTAVWPLEGGWWDWVIA